MIFGKERHYHKVRRKRLQKAALGWKKWFAWYRVELTGEETEGGIAVYAWLSFVERRFVVIDSWFDSNYNYHSGFSYFEHRKI